MTGLAPPLERLVTELSRLPGIGSRTAQRLAFHILRAPDQDARALAAAIGELKERITFCDVCGNLAEGAPGSGARSEPVDWTA